MLQKPWEANPRRLVGAPLGHQCDANWIIQDARAWYEFVRVLHKHDWEKVNSPEESLESSGSESPKHHPSDKSQPLGKSKLVKDMTDYHILSRYIY